MRHIVPGLALCFLLAACGSGESRVSGPAAPGPTTPSPGGEILRTTLVVTVRPEAPDLLLVRTLGWPDAIPGATVVLRREGGAETTAQSNAQGVAAFADLIEGSYQLTVARAFTTTELGTLDVADRDLSAWGGIRSANISNAGGVLPVDVTVTAARRGSMVFSEILSGGFITFQPDGTMYNYSSYLELFNNSDTTITLDGMLLAVTYGATRNYGPEYCAINRALYADTAGVWAGIIYQIPALGRRLKPGEFAVVATDAIDHQPFGTRDVYDLRGADYEVYLGPGDVDNPSVPNLISVGTTQQHSAYSTHGTYWLEGNGAVVIAMPQNVAALARRALTTQVRDYVLLPRETLLDVITVFVDDPRFPPFCAPTVGANIDAAPFVMNSFVMTNSSFQRQRHPGTSYLKRSRSSARDFSILRATPFSIP